MRFLTLEMIKKQLRIDDFFADDDILFENLGNASESFLESHLNCALDDIVAENSGELPETLLQALLVFVSYLYDNDGSGDTKDVPQAFWVLAKPYQNYTIA